MAPDGDLYHVPPLRPSRLLWLFAALKAFALAAHSAPFRREPPAASLATLPSPCTQAGGGGHDAWRKQLPKSEVPRASTTASAAASTRRPGAEAPPAEARGPKQSPPRELVVSETLKGRVGPAAL